MICENDARRREWDRSPGVWEEPVDQFSNPSAVAPFRAGYLLLMGGSSGSDARHSLSLQYGEVKTADAIPTYESITFTDVVNPAQPTSTVTQNGVFSG
ncbi:MAG: hypothetical protein QOJ69_2328, partial [Actinomycetota bacterium]|nr:hypothetical protein [Actinomycetota bacterium]